MAKIIFGRSYARAGLILGTVFLVWVGISRWSYSYNEDGHFYTAVAVQHFREPPFDSNLRQQAALLAFCAQLPDLAKEFDAVTLRVGVMSSWGGWAWGSFSYCGKDNDVCRMVTAHHYLHGLTDTASEPVTEAATAILRSLLRSGDRPNRIDPDRICAAGFALHLLGDSFAHRRLDSPSRMYAPGMGHYRDDHNPDLILYNKDRTELWVTLIQKLSDTLTISLGKSRLQVFSEIVKRNANTATSENLFNQAEMIAGLKGTLKGADGDQTQNWAPYKPPVENFTDKEGWWGRHVLQKSCANVVEIYQPPGSKGLDCDKVWELYKMTAIPEFAKRKIPAICPPA